MLPNGSERIIPSVVGYSATGQWLVGTPARNQYVLDPDNTVRSIKRKMGSDARVTMGGQQFTPQQISAFILRELKGIAERNLGEPVIRRGHHRPGLLHRRCPPGHPRRRAHRGLQRAPHHQRTDRRGAGLWPQPGSKIKWCWCTIWAAAPSTYRWSS